MKTNYLYHLAFTDRDEALALEAQLSEIYPNVMVDLIGHGAMKISDEVLDEDGNVVTEAVWDNRFMATVQVRFEVPELEPYVVDLPYWGNKIAGQDDGDVVMVPAPKSEWLKPQIQKWLTNHNISWATSMTKNELLALV